MTLSNRYFNILMYSHDTYGLGHIRRTMAIAQQLRDPNTNILILTGSPLAGRLAFPKYVDYVRMPGMIKKANNEYFPLTIRIDPQQAMEIRQSIIMATVQTFKPDLFIVDKEPQGLKKEVLPSLRWISENLAQTRTVLGLRDIMDDASTVKADWTKKNIYATIEDLYSEVWVYGEKKIYDPVQEYDIPDAISKKLYFTGYIPREVPPVNEPEDLRIELNVMTNEKLVAITTGGGGDGYHVLDTYLDMLEKMKNDAVMPPFKTVLVTGPFLSSRDKTSIMERAQNLDISCYEFFPKMETLITASDIVVCMGGYNTLCEVLSSGTLSLVIPRETPRKEQYIRAKAFNDQGLLDFIPWGSLTSERLEEKLLELLLKKENFDQAITGFKMNGITNICQRISTFWDTKNGNH